MERAACTASVHHVSEAARDDVRPPAAGVLHRAVVPTLRAGLSCAVLLSCLARAARTRSGKNQKRPGTARRARLVVGYRGSGRRLVVRRNAGQ